MKVVLLSSQSFIINTLKKLDTIFDIVSINEVEKMPDNILDDEYFILIHHLDNRSDYHIEYDFLKSYYTNYKLIALRNNTNNIEGCALLKKGYKGYMHSMSNHLILKDAIETVNLGNTWVYPELMQFLISSIPLTETSQNNLLDKITVKELEVLELVAQGLSNNKISQTLNIAEVTVKKHISLLFKKLDLKDRLSLALYFNNL